MSDDSETPWVNDSKTALPSETEVLVPFGWQVLVMPVQAPTKSAGGIIFADITIARDEYLAYVGQIVALGPLAYKHQKYQDMGITDADKPKRGEWWLFPQYRYHRIDFKGVKLLALNDDSFIGRVPDGVSPWDFKIER